mmetsp:Transcript_18190/g.50485  ORF Transcript_18190/g.50485 Transcript_18190/m.50485 type:complete len:319 (-) Transcript_18190:482-1438(-)
MLNYYLADVQQSATSTSESSKVTTAPATQATSMRREQQQQQQRQLHRQQDVTMPMEDPDPQWAVKVAVETSPQQLTLPPPNDPSCYADNNLLQPQEATRTMANFFSSIFEVSDDSSCESSFETPPRSRSSSVSCIGEAGGVCDDLQGARQCNMVHLGSMPFDGATREQMGLANPPLSSKRKINNAKSNNAKSKKATKRKTTQGKHGPPCDLVENITDLDIIFGRGGQSNKHSGNAWYRDVIEKNKRKHAKLDKVGKTALSKDIVCSVYARGGRFLKVDKATGQWYQASFNDARDKVAKALRSDNSPSSRAARRAKYGH